MKTWLVALAVITATPAAAANLLANGDFETGTTTGWTRTTFAGSNGTSGVYTNGANAPVSGLGTTINGAGGRFVYLTGQGGPGAYELRQSFTLSSAKTVMISFDHFANNFAGTTITGNGLNPFAGRAVQFALADLILASTPTFNNSSAIQTFYSGADAGPNPHGWTSYSFNVALGAGTYDLRFAQADNLLFFTQGVDNASVSVVPEPASWAMMIAGFGLVGAAMRRRTLALAA